MLNRATVTGPQPVRALGEANTRRSATAVLKTRRRQGAVSLREIFEDLAAPLGALTARQRRWLVEQLPDRR